jgi:hypothetical protein
MLTAVPDQLRAEPGSITARACPSWWPWSCRIAGAASRWPAVEVYETDSLLDVVSRTRLAAQLLRGARAVRSADGERVIAWGRLPLGGDVLSVEFSRGLRRKSRRNATVVEAAVVKVTSWCWLAVADGPYDAVTVRCGGTAIRSRLKRLRVGRP